MATPDRPSRFRSIVAAIVAGSVAAGCASSGGGGGGSSSSGLGGFMQTDTGKGTAVGAVGGAALGAIIDHADPWAGVLVGAAGGALTGALAGHFMDKRKQDLAKTLQPQVNAGDATVEMLPGKAIQVEMTGKTGFAPGSAVINDAFLGTLSPIASVVRTYGKMTVQVIGHPDAGGTQAERATIASQRAEAVRTQLLGMGVPPALVTASGTAISDSNDGKVVIILRPIVSG